MLFRSSGGGGRHWVLHFDPDTAAAVCGVDFTCLIFRPMRRWYCSLVCVGALFVGMTVTSGRAGHRTGDQAGDPRVLLPSARGTWLVPTHGRVLPGILRETGGRHHLGATVGRTVPRHSWLGGGALSMLLIWHLAAGIASRSVFHTLVA